MLLAEIEQRTDDWEAQYRARQALEMQLATERALRQQLEREVMALRMMLVKAGIVEEAA